MRPRIASAFCEPACSLIENLLMIIRRAVAGDAQKIGAVFDAAAREGWTYLGDLACNPMFPPEEWDTLVVEHAPTNALMGAIDESGDVVGFTSVHTRSGAMCLLLGR